MPDHSRKTSAGIIVLVVGLLLLVPCVLGALGLGAMLVYLMAPVQPMVIEQGPPDPAIEPAPIEPAPSGEY